MLSIDAVSHSTKTDDAAKEKFKTIMEAGSNVPVDTVRPKGVPEWFDAQLFARGQKYFYSNFYAMFASNLIGLILVLTVPTILDVLVFTNKSSDPYTAFRRYLDTIRHMLRWYRYDATNAKSKSQISVAIVHGLHCAANRVSNKSGLGLRVTQKDMSLTQFGFMGLPLLKKKELAIVGTEEDERALLHFWRTIGYLLGIQDKYNLCSGSLEEVRGTCALILRDVYAPGLLNPPPRFEHMVEALLDGMKPISPMLDTDAFMAFTHELCGVPVRQPLVARYSRWMYNVQVFTHSVLLTNAWLAFVFRPVLNYNMRFSVWLNVKFPVGAALQFGTKVFHRVREEVPPHPLQTVNGGAAMMQSAS
ncbi:uncharacterized protein LOC111030339 isoform X1 [Myzus persicae]|uniref:uncharacterized protein LOC111030339 isoform X1 n=1 Tax=Myzus persicae TaxID=13164 RepID=UPI000B9334CB|nr:uncharacterized protein LOC111030339 isoform X1 [Myzus persicae]XP_022165471.1 uncharacterized protein LOC111030339 isoform X1 [Myzus persicae]